MRFAILSLVAALPAASVMAAPLIAPGDPIIGIDATPISGSAYPDPEAPSFAIDGDDFSKYLNFGGAGSGFIITPISGSSVVQSFQMVTGNDAPDRDPFNFELFGTNDAITSTDNSIGLDENWSLIGSGELNPPVERNTAGPAFNLTNATAYTSYRMVFPETFGSTLMQFSEVQFYDGANATGNALFAPADPILAIDGPAGSPPAETAINAIDGDAATKYLHFGREGAGVIVTPSVGSSIAKAMQLTTANDFPERDATSFEVYGTNDAIISEEFSDGTEENWTLIDSGNITLPADRLTAGPMVPITNDTAYSSYKIVFPTIVDQSGVFPADSFQVAEIQLFDEFTGTLIGDTDGDGDIDDFDLLNAISNFTGSLAAGTGGKGIPEGDTDADADVDDFDLLNMISGFTGSLSTPSVPEPASMALLGLGGLALLRRRR